MRSLLLVTSLFGFVFLKACGGNSSKNEDAKKDSLERAKQDMQNPVDTPQSIQSDVQNTDTTQRNYNNGAKGDTTKKIYYHQSPNQHELDSIKKAKTKNK